MFGFFLLGLAWLMPLHFMPWVSWHSEVLGFCAALVLALETFRPRQGRTASFEVPRAALLLLLAGVVVLLQAAGGLIDFWGDALVLELYLGLCVLAMATGYARGKAALVRPGRELPASAEDPILPLAWVLLAGAMASSVIALVQVFDVWADAAWVVRMYELRRPGGNMAQPNQLGTLLLMGLASLDFLRRRGKLAPVVAVASFAVLTLGLASTESRTALLSLLFLCGWSLLGRRRGAVSTSPALAVGAAAVILALYAAWPPFMAWWGQFEPGAVVNARPGLRLVVWPQLLQAVAMKPWLGWGLQEVSKAHNAVASGYAAAEPYTYAHNLVLELALGWGIPLTVLAAVLVVAWFWRRATLARTDVAWYCIAAALPFCVHSMLEFPYAYAYFLLPLAYLAGVLEAETAGRALPRPGSRVAALAMAPLLVIAVVSVYDYLRIEEDFRVARFQAMRIGRTPAGYERPKILLLTQLDALLDAARLEPRTGMTAGELQLARQAALRYPSPATENRYALSLALNGSPVEALRQLQVIRTLHGEATYRQITNNWREMAKQHPDWAPLLKN